MLKWRFSASYVVATLSRLRKSENIMTNSQGINLKVLTHASFLSRSHTHSFSWKDCTAGTVTWSRRWWEWSCVSSPQTQNVFSPEPRCSVSPLPPESVSCVRTGSPPLPQSAQTLIKGQHGPGCNWKQIQPESPSSRNMLSAGERLAFQKHELCKKERQNRNSTWSLLLLYMYNLREGVTLC